MLQMCPVMMNHWCVAGQAHVGGVGAASALTSLEVSAVCYEAQEKITATLRPSPAGPITSRLPGLAEPHSASISSSPEG
jgi:hypothetical protein